uniref:Uncharacterized protein n=1 Tax=Vitis vinifera TaxID=29760 RepID=A5BSU2_VITVI|nr:hypothetical protein VITISV_024959 [Vitis vinifera]
MVSARFRRHSRRAAKSFRNNMLSSQGCEDGFHLEVPSFPLEAYIGQLQKEIHPIVQKGCGITSQQKGDFATLWKMLPSAWSDWLAMAATSSFQFRIAHRLKHWIVDFLSFEMNPFHAYYMFFRSSGSQQSKASNGALIGVEMKKLKPLEADHTKLKANFAGCEISLWLRNHKVMAAKSAFGCKMETLVCEISQPSCMLMKSS